MGSLFPFLDGRHPVFLVIITLKRPALHLIPELLWGSPSYHFKFEETEAQRGEVLVQDHTAGRAEPGSGPQAVLAPVLRAFCLSQWTLLLGAAPISGHSSEVSHVPGRGPPDKISRAVLGCVGAFRPLLR